MKRASLYLLLTIWSSLLAAQPAQQDVNSTAMTQKEALSTFTEDASYRAKRTAMKSALIPGWGQYVNKQYWKIPVIYAGVGLSAYFLIDNYNLYQEYTQAYLYKEDDDPETEIDKYANFSSSYVLSRRRTVREFLDYTVLAMVLGYAINIIDAAVFSHLDNFDVSPSISLRPPTQLNSFTSVDAIQFQAGIKLNIHL